MNGDYARIKTTIPLLFLASFGLYFVALNQTPYANGWDGYYYIMQVHSFIEKGAMHSPDYSLIYPFYIFISYIINDFILTFKIGTAILSGIFIVSAVKISWNLTRDFIASFAIGCFLLFSPILFFFASQFPKNLLGVIFFLWFIYFLVKKKMLWSGIFFLLGFITHRMIAGISIIILLVSFIKDFKLKLVLPFVGIAFIIAFSLPGIIHITDIERFSNLLSDRFYIPPIRFINFFGNDKLSIIWKLEIIMLYLAFLYFIYFTVFEFIKTEKNKSQNLYLLTALLILSLPIYSFSKASIGFRFYLVFNILSVLTIPFIAQSFNKYIKIVLICVFILLSAFSYKSNNPDFFDPPYKSYFATMQKANMFLKDENVDIIIAHQSLAQIFIIYTEYNATNWQPVDISKYESTWRIVANIRYFYFKKYLDDSDLEYLSHLNGEYYLLREDKWQIFYKRVLESENTGLLKKVNSWFNPGNPKPEYLLKRRSKDYTH